jgi:hypothetical protein
LEGTLVQTHLGVLKKFAAFRAEFTFASMLVLAVYVNHSFNGFFLSRDSRMLFNQLKPPQSSFHSNIRTYEDKHCYGSPNTVIGIYDKKEVFIVIDPKEGLFDSPALWSNNQSLITVVKDYFEILWLTAMEEPNL